MRSTVPLPSPRKTSRLSPWITTPLAPSPSSDKRPVFVRARMPLQYSPEPLIARYPPAMRVLRHMLCTAGTGPWFNIGTEQSSVNDGDTVNGAGVSVKCTVSSNGNGFSVFLFAELYGQAGGSFTLGQPSSPANFTASGPQSGIYVSTTGRQGTTTASENDC